MNNFRLKTLVLLTALLASGCYGFFMMKNQLFPYEELAAVWMHFKAPKEVVDANETEAIIHTALTDLRVEKYPVKFLYSRGRSSRGGGGIAESKGVTLGINRWGQFFKYETGSITELPLNLKTNLPQLSKLRISETELTRLGIDLQYIKARGFDPVDPSTYNTRSFRFLDLELARIQQQFHLFVSYYYWHPEQKCKTIRVAELVFSTYSELSAAKQNQDWTTLLETQPCLKIDYRNNSPFQSPNSGGRLAYNQHDKMLYFSVGDHHLDGYNNEAMASQSSDMDYGKVHKIDLKTKTHAVYTIGHRNPQGLYVTRHSKILATEHGPKGGDELNILTESKNFGWPYVIFGAQYRSYEWPLSNTQGKHENFERPLYVWLPSIGVSNLTEITDKSSVWNGNLIVSSLKAASLFRVALHEENVAYIEKIFIGERIRDLEALTDGKLAIWTDSSSLLVVEPVRRID